MIAQALRSGDRVGPYEVVGLLGQGGMGEIYVGRDTTLQRQVALKVLRESDRLDERRRARLEREAHVLASLNHPNIATLHGVETVAGVQALVMELVEGDTLAERLCGDAPLSVEQTLRIAAQIVDALDAAHARGIVHRDLSPSNIKVRPDGTVKLLDFGLAKAWDRPGEGNPVGATVTVAAEGGAAILGTACYMCPEQTRGLQVDARADIWAFGCVLFEMLAGVRAFDGPTRPDITAAVLEREPDWAALPAATPENLERLLRRCLEKDRNRRLRHIADARPDLEDARFGEDVATRAPSRPARRRYSMLTVTAAVAAVALAAAGGFIIGARGGNAASSVGATQFVLLPPDGTAFGSGVTDRTPALAISANGERLAFVATDRTGHRQLWIRSIRSLAAEPLVGTNGAREPFWSPDGTAVGFFAEGKLKTIAASGGVPVTLADATTGSGGAWNRDNVILFAPSTQSGLFRIPASGGTARAVTTIKGGEYGHVYPQFLPDGHRFLYLARGTRELKGIYVASLEGDNPVRLLEAREKARFAPPDRLLFLRDGRLLWQHLDPLTLRLSGDPITAAESVGFIATDGRASFDASDTGALVYRANGLLAASQPIVVDRAGRTIAAVGEPGDYQTASWSPDGQSVAVEKHDLRTSTGDLWMIALNGGTTSRLTFDGMHNNKAVWSPDGKHIVFTGRPDGVRNLHMKEDLNTERDEPLLAPGPDRNPSDWSRDGRYVFYYEGVEPQRDIWYLSLPERKPTPYLRTAFDEYEGRLSPDGRWVAYVSNETGTREVYVRSFPAATQKHQISTGGGSAPRWNRNGHELFFVGASKTVDVVQVQTAGDSFAASVPKVLFTPDMRGSEASIITPDSWFDTSGDRFFIIPPPAGPLPSALPITVAVDWARR